MTSESLQTPPPPAAGRLSADFVITFLKDIAGYSGDFVDAVILIAILDANVRHVMSDLQLAQRYASFDSAVPNTLRRPLSINAIAASLDMPFETTRRRIHALCEQDMCTVTREGVIVAEGQLMSADLEAIANRNFAHLRALYTNLRVLAPAVELVVAGEDGSAQPAQRAEAPVRLAMRATFGYVLRYLEYGRPMGGDFLSSILFLAIAVANVEHITHLPDASARFGEPDTVVPDAHRRRVSVQALAKFTGLPFETARRRVNQLIESGLCVRDEEGVYVTAAILRSPPLVTLRQVNAAALQRLFTGLARAGVRFD